MGQREWSSEGKPEKLLSISISQLLFWVVWESPTALGSEGGAGFTEAVGPSDPMLQPIGFTDGETEVWSTKATCLRFPRKLETGWTNTQVSEFPVQVTPFFGKEKSPAISIHEDEREQRQMRVVGRS